MQNKRIINEPFFIFCFFFVFIFAIVLNSCFINSNDTTVLYITLPISIVGIIGYFLLMNYFSCKIIYDGEYIIRKGLFFGMYLKIHKSEIKKVLVLQIGRSQYYELYDGIHNSYSLMRKNGSIKISYSKQGKEFVKLFWDGKIEITNI